MVLCWDVWIVSHLPHPEVPGGRALKRSKKKKKKVKYAFLKIELLFSAVACKTKKWFLKLSFWVNNQWFWAVGRESHWLLTGPAHHLPTLFRCAINWRRLMQAFRLCARCLAWLFLWMLVEWVFFFLYASSCCVFPRCFHLQVPVCREKTIFTAVLIV